MAYAEVTDIEARWRTLDADEQARADTLIVDASAMLDALVDVREDDEAQAALLKTVCCSMVIRAMSATADAFGVSNATVTAGPYSQTMTYANPSGDMYLTKMERRLLSVSTGYIGSISPRIGAPDD